ncbi:MAG TPA: hypothetical protein DDY17_04090 [Syntrophaceae bacterium]|nr:hypothetical protein [Syntrophaceae bacterium]
MSQKFSVSGRHQKVFLAGVINTAPEQAIKAAVRDAAEAATDFSWLSKGDTVFIKLAHNSGNPYPATTSPVAVGAMIELLKDKGARWVIVGDMAGIEYVKLSPKGFSGSTRRLMAVSGMARAVQVVGGELHCFEEDGWNSFYEDTLAVGTHWKRGPMMPAILKDVDHIILMPRCGRHILTGSTLGLKAVVGYWRSDTRLEYHHDASTLQEKTAEGNTAETLHTKQRLVITAADKILTTHGPDKGYVCQPDFGLIIASESVVANDMVSLAWLLLNRRNTPLSEKSVFKDPHTSQLVVSIGNRWIVNKLGGLIPAFTCEKLTGSAINSFWDDRVLKHACQVFGGLPDVLLESTNNAVPAYLKKQLSGMIVPIYS